MSRIIYTARVVSTEDPDGIGRVQVALDGFEATVDLPWIRMVGAYASNGFGAVFLPEEDDEVIVLQGDGDGLDQMICLGSVYNGARKPNYSNDDGDNVVKEIRTRSGHALVFRDEDDKESISLSTPDKKLCIELDHANGKITVSASDDIALHVSDGTVTVTCKDAKVSASGDIRIEGENRISVESTTADIDVTGATEIVLKSNSTVTVQAPKINLSGSRVELG